MWIIMGLIAFILLYYSGFAHYFVGGDDIWLYMSAPGGWNRVIELFRDIGGTYRPIPFSLFSVYHLFGSNVYAMHWVPITMHAANVVLVYLLTLHFGKSRFGSLVAAIVYGVSHIVFFDVFTLTGLVDQLFLLFSLGSIISLYRRFESSIHQKQWLSVSWVLFTLTMFSKESFVSVLLVITYLLWQKRNNLKYYLLFWAPTAIYFFLKLTLYRQQGAAYSYMINLETLSKNLFDYGLWLINWRHGWQMGMPYPPYPYYDLISVGFAILLVITTWNVWKKNRQVFWLSVWWVVVGLIPFYFLGRTLPFYLEFSLVGMCVMVASGIEKKWGLGLSILLLAIYMSMTTKAQWVTNSFSARGVQTAEKFRDQVINKYDWNKYDTLCITGMGEYELWATGVGQLIKLYRPAVKVVIAGECELFGRRVKYDENKYYTD